jgi:hypothetical protein
MAVSGKITALCEKWWSDLTASARTDLVDTGTKFLSTLGWHDATHVESDESRASWLVSANEKTKLAVHCLMPQQLVPPSAVLSQGLDFCETTLMLVGDALDEGWDYVLITDFQRFYLYDAASDELLLHADSPHFFETGMLGKLTSEAVAERSLEEIRREPRSFMARQLRVWAQRTRSSMESMSPMNEDTAGEVIDRLLLLRFLYEHPVYEREDWSLRHLVSGIAWNAFEEGETPCGAALLNVFRELHHRWGVAAFADSAVVTQVFSTEDLARRLMRELALLSKAKFDTATILESFNYGDAAEKARVRLVPEPHEGREEFLAGRSAENLGETFLEIDVLEEGYRVIGHWVDKLAAMQRRLDLEMGVPTVSAEALSEESPLLDWAETSTRGGASGNDAYHRVLENSLRIWVDSPRQLRTARLMLTLHLIECYEEAAAPPNRFPDVAAVCASRPRFLDTDKQRIYQAHSFRDEWEVV